MHVFLRTEIRTEFNSFPKTSIVFESGKRLKSFLIQYTYSANTLRSINALLTKFNENKSGVIRSPDSGISYFFNDHESINGTIFFLTKLLSEAIHLKRRILVVIPTLEDLNLIYYGKSYKNLKWYKDFKQIALETNTEFVDLANHFKKEKYKKMIFTCDWHWNPYGHKEVANLIIKKALMIGTMISNLEVPWIEDGYFDIIGGLGWGEGSKWFEGKKI